MAGTQVLLDWHALGKAQEVRISSRLAQPPLPVTRLAVQSNLAGPVIRLQQGETDGWAMGLPDSSFKNL